MNFNRFKQEDFKARLSAVPKQTPKSLLPTGFLNGPPKQAAVLLPLLWQKDGWHLLFIRRTTVEGDMHSGQVAFPGGRRDSEDETLEATALRETQEELGVLPEDIEILGALNEYLVISNYNVTPIVGVMPWPYTLTLGTNEVSRAFTIPLNWLADPANHTLKTRELPTENKGTISVIYFDEYDGEMLWGASARFMLDFLKAIA